MAKRALIHCNADLQQGMGHLARSLCLAEEAQNRGWDVVIAGQFGGRAIDHAAEMAPRQEIVSLNPEAPLKDLHEYMIAREIQLLHIDSYDTNLDTFEAGSALVSNMQDGEFGRRHADLHIDANLDAELHYHAYSLGERAIVGASGMQIRSAVQVLKHEVRQDISAPFHVLVLLGGTDPFNLTPRLTQLLAAHTELQLTVICRPEMHSVLRESLVPSTRPRVSIIPFTADLPALANSMDLVVTAAGTSVWDFAAAGIPMGIIAVAENQLAGYRACKAHGLGIALGEPPHAEIDEQIIRLLAVLGDEGELRSLARRGASLVDGQGAWRVVSAWEEMLDAKLTQRQGRRSPQLNTQNSGQPPLTARPATLSDAKRLFDWRNDESTRAVSRTSEVIDWAQHLAWLGRSLEHSDRQLLVIEAKDDPVATVRWDKVSDRTWEVSITLAPEQRGKGLAAAVLAAGESVFSETLPVRLLAGIHTSNEASRRLFSRAGYLPSLPADELGFETREKWLLK